MSWPLASHFSVMLQSPAIAFRDPELQRLRIEKDGRNQPKPWAGAFAVVYKAVADGGRTYALRVFTTESPERRERYDRISEYLRARKVSCLVDFEYRDRSIRSAGDGKWYPLILMDWIQGETLFQWVRARVGERNQAALAEAARRWEALVRELAEAQIAHGDLQHANVMVTRSGELKLVDYDGLCVPSLVGRRNLEVGVEPYQHPDRNEQTPLSLDLDNFSALVIYVALRALAADPSLWAKYVEAPVYDKLLFRREDFQAPGASPLYHDLRKSPDQDVRELTEQLFDLAQPGIGQTPRLEDVARPFARIERLLAAGQWRAAVSLLNRRRKFRDAPDHLRPLIQNAYEHVCREQAWAAFQRIPPLVDETHDRRRIQAWNEPLFAGFAPAEQCRAEIQEARRRIAIVDELARRVEQAGTEPTIRQEWDLFVLARRLPRKYQHRLRPRIRQARHTVLAMRGIERAVRILDDDAEIVTAWRRVQKYQCAALVNPERLPRIEAALKRQEQLARLSKQRDEEASVLLEALCEKDRTAFLKAFDARLIRHDPERFRRQEPLVSQWTRSEILPLERIGLRPAEDRDSLAWVDKREGVFRVQWTWPEARFANECLLGICSQKPQIEDDPLELELGCRVPLDRQHWEAVGGCRTLCIRGEWREWWVVVWAIVDLGYRLFYSHPLILGRPEDARKASRRFWR